MNPADEQRYRRMLALLLLLEQSIATMTAALEHEALTVSEWQAVVARLLTRYGAAVLMLGLDASVLTAAEQAQVAAMVRTQVGYLDKFAAEMRTNQANKFAIWDSTWNARAQMYAGAVLPLYWEGVTKGLNLPAYPADGSSECLGNDRCLWRIEWLNVDDGDADCYWTLEPAAEHCGTCVERAVKWNPLHLRGGEPATDTR